MHSPVPDPSPQPGSSRSAPVRKLGLRLYVAGSSPNSLIAIRNLEQFCTSLVQGSFDAEVVDVLAQPALALRASVLVTPLLELSLPGGESRRLVGTLRDTAQLRLLAQGAGA